MTVSTLTQPLETQPTHELDSWAGQSARHSFHAENLEEALTWQKRCHSALWETIGFLDSPRVDPAPELISEVDRVDHVRRKIMINTATNARMPVYLLTPKYVQQPLPVVLAYAGHGYGAKDIVGLWEDGSERWLPDGYHKDFAIEICRKGFLVATPEIACFGERQTDYGQLGIGQGEPTTCHNASTYAFMLGKSMVGMRVRDSMRLVDYLATVPEADTSRLGAMGISGGGMLTFFHTALDERIKACVVSGYYSSFRDSILAMHHCTCNFVPGLLNIGEMSDIVGLIMPRPMLVEAGTHDPIFPVETVRRSVERAREICTIFGGDGANDVEYDEFEGRHQISGRRAYDFLLERVT